MKILSTFDLYLWNYYVPKLSEENFKNRMFCIFAMAYISVFKLPRKFLINYFRGNGKEMIIETSNLIVNNPVVFDSFFEAVTTSKSKGLTNGSLDICQTDVHEPNYKYSIGSFTINYSLNGESIEISVNSCYNFQLRPNRITKHLHSWLYLLSTKGYSMNFRIKGNTWTTSFSELASSKISNKSKKYPKYTYLV